MSVSHRRLDPAFVKAIRASTHNQVVLASLAGFASPSQLSKVVHRKLTVTPLTTARLKVLAEVVHYTGDLFAEVRR